MFAEQPDKLTQSHRLPGAEVVYALCTVHGQQYKGSGDIIYMQIVAQLCATCGLKFSLILPQPSQMRQKSLLPFSRSVHLKNARPAHGHI